MVTFIVERNCHKSPGFMGEGSDSLFLKIQNLYKHIQHYLKT